MLVMMAWKVTAILDSRLRRRAAEEAMRVALPRVAVSEARS